MNILNIDYLLSALLPSGSGIDGNWQFDNLKNGKIKAYNSYTCYNEGGMVDGYQDFYLLLEFANGAELHLIDFHFTNGSYLSQKYQLKDYFDNLFFESIHDIISYNKTPNLINEL